MNNKIFLALLLVLLCVGCEKTVIAYPGNTQDTDPKAPEGKTMTYPDDMEFKTPHRSNANARMLLSRLGLDPDFENTGSMPIDDFLKVTDKYLRMNVSDKDNPYYDEVEMYDMEAKRFKKEYPEITHVGFN